MKGHEMLIPVSPDTILTWKQARSLNRASIDRLKKRMEAQGYLEQFTLAVVAIEGGYRGFDGKHRHTTVLELNLPTVPVHVYEGLTDEQEWALARQLNEANKDFTPVTFVEDAEFIWARDGEGYTLPQVAEMIGWSLSLVKHYKALKAIDQSVWALIVPIVH
jgi:ParB-like chromosome segregation protein Spo0J